MPVLCVGVGVYFFGYFFGEGSSFHLVLFTVWGVMLVFTPGV